MSKYGFIDGFDFKNCECERYWSFPKSYKGDKKEATKEMIFSDMFYGSLKNDGHYARLIKDEDGNIILQGRSKSVSGDYLDKHEWVPQLNSFFDSLPNGTCLLGELYFPSKRGSRNVTTILGCLAPKAIERQEKGEKLYYYVFDVWAYGGKSYLSTPMEKRLETLSQIKESVTNPYTQVATYYSSPQEIWDNLGKILSSGGEGMVLYRKDGLPAPGKRTARKTLKIKTEIEMTIDAFVDGDYKPAKRLSDTRFPQAWEYWQNEKTLEKINKNMFNAQAAGETWVPITKAYYYGWASAISFSVMKDGKPVHVAYISGIPDEIKRDIVFNPEKLKNKVAELTAMEVEKDTKCLRHGRIVTWREDKNFNDCTYDQIEQ